MPIIRLHNPRRRHTKRAARRRSSNKRRRNSLGEGVLTFMANPKRKKRSSSGRHHRRRVVRHRASNPVAHHRRRRRHNEPGRHRRRHNPMMRHHRRRHHNPAIFGDVKSLVWDAGYLAAGGITTRSLPQLVVPNYNSSWLGYGLNLLTAGLTSALISRWRGAAAGRTWLLGGFAFTIARVIEDYSGKQILSFAQYTPPAQLSGDATYGMAGVYAGLNFPLPSNSLPPSVMAALPPGPAAAVPVAESAKAGMGWDGSFN